MSRTIARWAAPLAFAIAVGMIACSDDKPDTLAEDTSLSRDLQMANADTSVQPALQDVPAGTSVTPTAVAPTPAPRTTAPVRKSSGTVVRTPARVTPAPAPAPTTARTSSGNTVTRTSGGSERAVGSIAAGSTLSMTANSRICTNTNRVGQRFNATVSETVTGSNGARIPAGATANVEITELKRSENANDNVVMGFRVISVSFGGRTYPVDATTQYARVEKVRNQPRDKDVQKVVGGAAVGAIIGQVLGKSTKSTVIGAATGAAAGTAAAAATANFEGCVPDGGRITVSLDAPMQVQA